MAAGASLGSLIPVAMVLVGIVSILRGRRSASRAGTDPEAERRQAAAAEMERRMASYLAGRDSGGGYPAPRDRNEEENRR
jgi:hypothetical protein